MNENNATNEIAPQVGDREIVVTSVFDAPRDLVFDAWTKEEHVSKWWGPRGFTTTFQTFDLKPDGTWEFIMHSPDGVDFPNTHVFVEVVKPERIVFKHDVFPHFLATASFEDLDGKTKLTYRTVFEENTATFDKVKTYAVPGSEEMMECLEEHLASMS